jgi:hypothetical protein
LPLHRERQSRSDRRSVGAGAEAATFRLNEDIPSLR